MAQQSRTSLKTDLASNFADNTTGAITPLIVRNFLTNLIDSNINNTDDVGIFSTVTAIPTADVLTAYTTPVELVAAPGAGKIILPTAIVVTMDYNSVAYATNTTIRFAWDDGVTGLGLLASLIDQTSDQTGVYLPASFVTPASNPIANKNFCFAISTGNPTAGNSGLVVYTNYLLITL